MQQGSLPLEQQTAKTGSTAHHKRRPTPHKGALGKSSGPNQNGPFLECKPKSMSQRRQTMPQSLGTGGPRTRNVRPFLRGTGNPHFWITKSRIARSLNAKAHPHRAGPIGCSGQQHLSKASVGMVLVPLPSCSKDPCPWSNARPRPVPRPTESSVTSPMGAFVSFSKRNQNGPFLECKPKRMI